MWTVWNQSTVNEKVYTVSLLSMALVMWIAVHWARRRTGTAPRPLAHPDRLPAHARSTNHMMGVLAAPAVAIYVLWTDWRVALRPWVLLMALALVLAVSGLWTEA